MNRRYFVQDQGFHALTPFNSLLIGQLASCFQNVLERFRISYVLNSEIKSLLMFEYV